MNPDDVLPTDASATTPVTPADSRFDSLRTLTSARIGLGRAGTSLPTRALLDFQFAHAQARDAVHTPLDVHALIGDLASRQVAHLHVQSAAEDRDTYLKRPDLGRQLSPASALRLSEASKAQATSAEGNAETGADLCIVVADGLSALAIHRHAAEMVGRILAMCSEDGWHCTPVVIVEQGRVAIADAIGEAFKARMTAILIGERPGLSSPDSLGIYFTYGPQKGLTDAARNCLSNIRPEGQNYTLAVHRLRYLMQQAMKRQLSGVALKDEADIPTVANGPGNFLV